MGAAATSLTGVHAAIVFFALLLVGVSSVVFLSSVGALLVLPHAFVALGFAGLYGFCRYGKSRFVRSLRLTAPLGLCAFVAGSLAIHLIDTSATSLTAQAAGLISVPFAVFLAVTATSRIEHGFLLGIVGMHYLAGVWRMPQGPEFPLLFLAGVVALIGLFVLSTLQQTLRAHVKMHRQRDMVGLDSAVVTGRTPPVSLSGALSAVAVLALILTAALFVFLPRPEALATLLPDDHPEPEPERELRRFGDDYHERLAEGPGREGAGARMGMDRFVRARPGVTLFEDDTTHYLLEVRSAADGAPQELHPQLFYFRTAVFDHFDGQTWRPSSDSEAHWNQLRDPNGIRLPLGRAVQENRSVPGYTSWLRGYLGVDGNEYGDDRLRLSLTFTATGADRSDMLPMPRFALQTSATQLDYNTYFDTLRRPEGADVPYPTYTVDAVAIVPQRDWLDDDVRSTEFAGGRFRTLPASRSGYYADLAEAIVAEWEQRHGHSVRNDWDRTQAIIDYLRIGGGFHYSLTAPASVDGAQLLETFLKSARFGSCTLYASGAAVLLRELGISTRIVVGYHGGEFDEVIGAYRIRALHAHAWIEVHFRDYGWFPLDPTPARRRDLDPFAQRTSHSEGGDNGGNETQNGASGEPEPDNDLEGGDTEALPQPDQPDEQVPDEHVEADAEPPQTEEDSAAQTDDTADAASDDVDDDDDAQVGADTPSSTNLVGGFNVTMRGELFAWLGGLTPMLQRHATLIVALLMLLASIGCFVLWYRQRQQQAGGTAASLALRGRAGKAEARLVNAYERALSRLARLGLERLPRQTPAEFAAAVRPRLSHVPGAVQAFERLTDWFYRLRFGHHRLNEAEKAELDKLYSTFVAELSATAKRKGLG